jgi:hypothetical protein
MHTFRVFVSIYFRNKLVISKLITLQMCHQEESKNVFSHISLRLHNIDVT